MIAGSLRSKSIDPRRRRRWLRISNSSCIVSNIGTKSRYFFNSSGSRSSRIALTSV